MSMYDSLPKEAKDLVDATVKTLEPLTWSDRRQKIGGLVMNMNPAGSKEAADPETPDPWWNPLWCAMGHYVAACIERLGFSEPDNQDQALVYLLSWDLEHIHAANRYFNAHPEEWASLEAKFAVKH